jgi:hypothetical protein
MSFSLASFAMGSVCEGVELGLENKNMYTNGVVSHYRQLMEMGVLKEKGTDVRGEKERKTEEVVIDA